MQASEGAILRFRNNSKIEKKIFQIDVSNIYFFFFMLNSTPIANIITPLFRRRNAKRSTQPSHVGFVFNQL